MNRARRRASAAAFLLLAFAWGCEPPPSDAVSDSARNPGTAAPEAHPSFPLILEDDAGRRIVLEGEPRRIVSLVPAATRILLELGGNERLVGRTEYDEDPALASLPSVGGGLQPSMERLVSLEPDLVVRFQAASDPDTPRHLDAAGIPHLAVRPDGIEDIFRMIDLLGRAVGESQRARALESGIVETMRRVADRVKDVPRPRAAYILGGDPPLVAGGGTFLHELIELAGADNVLAHVHELYAPVSVEELIAAEIDVLFVTEGASVPGALRRLPIIRVPREVESPGPDVGASAHHLGRALHPDRFP